MGLRSRVGWDAIACAPLILAPSLPGPVAAARAPDPIIDPGGLRGTTFSVEGSIYPEGPIAGDGFDPESAETIGRWLCRGWLLLNEDRPEPYVTIQEYILGEIRPEPTPNFRFVFRLS